jgi:hypothetical protein
MVVLLVDVVIAVAVVMASSKCVAVERNWQ